MTSTLDKYASEVAGILAQIYTKIDSQTMERMPNLRAISVYGGGYNNIDVRTATLRKVIVTRVPDYCNHEVTEYVLACILQHAKKLDIFREQAKAGRWGAMAVSNAPMDEWTTDKIEQIPQRVSGSTLLIIGYGKIGRMLTEKASCLGMKVLVYDPYVEDADSLHSLDEGLTKADFVSINALLTNETRNMIGAKEFRKMKKTAFLINSSRGEIIDERELIEAVKNRTIRGAALDVVAGEPPDDSREVFHTPGIFITPHVAYISEVSFRELKNRATKNMILTLKGERPPDAVN
jgi:phosphoglycerate dehydrogenase-like enzyme